MKLGDTFSSFEAFESCFTVYKDTNFVDYFTKDCKTLASINVKYPNGRMSTASKELKYYYIKFCCIHGGTYKKKKISLDQRVTSTMRQGCEASIYLKASENGKLLEITKINENHNHEISRTLYSHLPSQKKTTPETKAIVLELMDLKANKKMIQNKIMKQSGTVITLKDLSNTTAGNHYSKNDLAEVVHKLKENFNCIVEISTDETNNLNGIFIQDKVMAESFTSFPEVVFADVTYKLLDLRLPIYVLMTEDGNGQSEIVAIGLLVNEEEITLRWFFETFKKNNPASIKTRAYVTDKVMKERNVIRSVFPNAALTICLFHTLRTFNQEITCEKQNITPKQRDDIKQIFQNLTCCKTQLEYDSLYHHLQAMAPESIMEYYNKNWHGIRNEWVMGMTFNTVNFMNKTNNRFESFNGKLKPVISNVSTLDDFVEKLLIVLDCVRMERDKNAIKLVQKQPTQKNSIPELQQFYSLLTPYAFNSLKTQFECAAETDVLEKTTENNCSCLFYKSMRLPCRHIFNLRKKQSLSLYDNSLCDERWTRNFYYQNQRVFKNVEVINTDIDTTTMTTLYKKKKIPTTHEKFCKASIIGAKIADLVSRSSNIHYQRKIEQLEFVFDTWLKGQELSLHILGADDEVMDVVEEECCEDNDVDAVEDKCYLSLDNCNGLMEVTDDEVMDVIEKECCENNDVVDAVEDKCRSQGAANNADVMENIHSSSKNCNSLDFERDLEENFFGQHIASKIVVSALAGNLHRSKYNKKPLVMCFHGSSGTGKNYLSDLIAKHMFYWEELEKVQYHIFHGRSDFQMTSQIEHYKEKLHSYVKSAIKSCDTNLFVFDEVHEIPMGILDMLGPILENNDVSIDSRNSIFLFLTNAGSDYILQKSLDNLANGFSRKNMKIEDFDTILLKSAFNEKGGLKRSSLIDSHIIDFYVPFLPLEKFHVQQCMEAELKHLEKHLDSETKSQILHMATFGPEPEKIFSKAGCKRIKGWVSTKTNDD